MSLNFPSLNYLALQARQSLWRFPMVLVSALVGVVAAIFLIETEAEVFNRFPYINVMLCAALGISLYFCAAVLVRRQGFGLVGKVISQAVATVILVLLYLGLPDSESTHNMSQPYIRFAFYAAIVHLLVSFAPFLQTGQLNGFWNYNKALFLRFLTSMLYSGVLYVGLVLWLAALRLLFDVAIPDELSFELFVVIGGLFNTWFFLAGVPLDFAGLDSITVYPRGLKVFTQYILLPLLALYLLILYSYGIKIIFTWNWPEGIVSYLIMAVAVAGIFTVLLLWPYATFAQSRWVRSAGRAYYGLLLPLLVLLFLAIGMRLAEYGFTVNRYLILSIGIWLTVVCAYFLSGRTSIKFVPISLAILLIVFSFGPWGIFAVSARSQTKRLHTLLNNAGIMEDGRVRNEVMWVQDSLPDFYSPKKNTIAVSDSVHNEILSIINYLDDFHGFGTIRPWYVQDLDSMVTVADADTARKSWDRMTEARIYMETLGLSYNTKSTDSSVQYHHYYNASPGVTEVRGFERVILLDQLFYYSETNDWEEDAAARKREKTKTFDGKEYRILSVRDSSHVLTIITPDDTVAFSISHLTKNLHRKYERRDIDRIPATELRIDTVTAQRSYRLDIEDFSIRNRLGEDVLQSVSGKLLIGERKAERE